MRRALLLLLLAACKGGDTGDTGPVDTDDDTGPCTDADEDGSCVEQGDCDDTNPLVHPGADDVPYNDRDEDCVNGDLTDVDGDGFAGPSGVGDDCNDGNPTIHPGAPEVCYDTVDDDCDGVAPLDDCDGDGFLKSEDCDDEDPAVNPDAAEIWYDGIDGDCDRWSDFDQDRDGDDHDKWGGEDCDDADPTVSSDALERWDGDDQDCDGLDQLDEHDGWKSYDGSFQDFAWTSSMAVMSDLDGDGLPEIFAGDLARRDAEGDLFGGGGYLISTGASEGRTDEVEICEFAGSYKQELFGWSAANAGDLDGDGYDELLVGAPAYGDDAQGATLLFTGDRLRYGGSIVSTAAHAELDGLSWVGSQVAVLDDVDGDGVDDLVSGNDNWGLTGMVVFSGAQAVAGGQLGLTDAIGYASETTALGGGIVGKVDLDQDGTSDVLVGRTVPEFVCGGACVGTSRVYLVPVDAMTGSFTLAAHDFLVGATDSGLGATIGVLDDADGDGYPEVTLADPFTNGLDGTDNGGTVYVVDGDDFAGGANVADVAMFTTTAPAGGTFLRVGPRTADHDDDGAPDLLVGAPGNSDVASVVTGTFVSTGTGAVYYFPGAMVAAGGTVDLADAPSSFTTFLTSATFGMSFVVGEFNGDSRADVAIGAPFAGYGKLWIYDSAL